MGGRGARKTRDTRRHGHTDMHKGVNTSILDEIEFDTYNNKLEIYSSNHVCVEYDVPVHQEMNDEEVFIEITKSKNEVKSKLKVKINELTTKIGNMKNKCQKLVRKLRIIEDKPTEYDKEEQNFVNNLAAKCTLKMKEFIAGKYHVSQNVIEANSEEQRRVSKQNKNRQKRPTRSDKEKRKRQKEVELRKKERFFTRAKEISQRKMKNKNEVRKQIEQQKQINKNELDYKTLLLIMNQRDRHEQQTGIGENPFTKGLNIKPYSFTGKFQTNEEVIQSNKKLAEIHTKRKIERELIDKEQEQLVRKIARKEDNAIAA